MLPEEKVTRPKGAFIKHYDFEQSGVNLDAEYEENFEEKQQEDPFREQNLVEKVFDMDHDFRCMSRQRNEEYELTFSRGLKDYVDGDWLSALMTFQQAKEQIGDINKDGPLKYMIEMIEKNGTQKPDDWKNGFEIDKKPVPPEVLYEDDDMDDPI